MCTYFAFSNLEAKSAQVDKTVAEKNDIPRKTKVKTNSTYETNMSEKYIQERVHILMRIPYDLFIKITFHMKISENGLTLLKRLEGLELKAYLCSGGVWTIGYGHTARVSKDMRITETQADAFLRADVSWAEKAVNDENLQLTQNQFDALVSFVFNVGPKAFRGSALLSMIRVNPHSQNIRSQFAKWRLAGGKIVPGLTHRRNAETDLYFKK